MESNKELQVWGIEGIRPNLAITSKVELYNVRSLLDYLERESIETDFAWCEGCYDKKSRDLTRKRIAKRVLHPRVCTACSSAWNAICERCLGICYRCEKSALDQFEICSNWPSHRFWCPRCFRSGLEAPLVMCLNTNTLSQMGHNETKYYSSCHLYCFV